MINNIDKEPFAKTYNYIGFTFGIIGRDHPSFDSWLLSEVFSVQGKYKKGDRFGKVIHCRMSEYKDTPLLDTVELPNILLDCESVFHKYILEALHDGYSAVIWSNQFYLPHRTSYQKEHYTHDNLVYGYNYENNSYLFMGYDERRRFAGYEVTASELYQSFATRAYDVPIYLIKRNSANVPVDWWKVACDFRNYCERKRVPELHSYEMSYGIDTLRTMISMLGEVKGNEGVIDFRLLSSIYEHKKILEYKFKLLVENGVEFGYANVGDKLKENMAEAQKCLNLSLQYNMDRNVDRKAKIVDCIQDKLRGIICSEEAVFPVLLDGVEGHKRKVIGLEMRLLPATRSARGRNDGAGIREV